MCWFQRLQEESELERQREEYRLELEKQELRRVEIERLAQEAEWKRVKLFLFYIFSMACVIVIFLSFD